MIEITEITIPRYEIRQFGKLSGIKRYTEFGEAVPMEYWENRPDFDLISKPIIAFLRSNFNNKRIGLRMLGSGEHEHKSLDELLKIIQRIGHDRYDENRKDSKYGNMNLKEIEVFMLELMIGKELGLDGEEQIKHALNSFYIYGEKPTRVDIGIVYDLRYIKKKLIQYDGDEEICHAFIDTEKAPESILALIKLI